MCQRQDPYANHPYAQCPRCESRAISEFHWSGRLRFVCRECTFNWLRESSASRQGTEN
jgi:transposase-like protein